MSDRVMIDYTVVKSLDIKRLSSAVMDLALSGWEVHGSLLEAKGFYHQPMARYEPVVEEGKTLAEVFGEAADVAKGRSR